ncbi:MAG: FAD-dependent oxidoreductase [Alphaproteobacteria bacterium]|nr:FAD-dependent oxidoreductase [Alphaproteobacteria bacterium]
MDRTSVSGKTPTIAEMTDLLVIGAGPAGCAAAIDAAGRGLKVMLVDENPVDFEAMNNEIPLHFGGRMTGAVRNRNAMTDAVLEGSPAIAEAFEAGVDVRLGTACWGLFVKAPTATWVDRPMAGIADAEGVRHIGFEHAIIAAGSRDMGLAFPGWELPGVMGAAAARRLATHYDALAARRAVILGSGAEALLTALTLIEAGTACAAVVEAAGAPIGPSDLISQITERGTEILTDHVVAQAEGDLDGVTRVMVAAVDRDGRHVAGSARAIECDTVVLGIAAIPAIELLEAAGCRMTFDARRGGQVPVLDSGQRTSRPGIYAIGDIAGIWPEKSTDPSVAVAEAQRAVAAILATEDRLDISAAPPEPAIDIDAYLKHWVRASVIEAAGEPHVCQCEDVTARDVLEVRPPRYLDWQAPTQKPTDLVSLLGNGPPNPDQVKRLTRAGMGQCQGRRCREQVAVLLALGAGVPLAGVPLATYRAPVRPIRLDQLAETEEQPEMTETWEGWFGIPSMWLAPWELGPDGRPLADDSDD